MDSHAHQPQGTTTEPTGERSNGASVARQARGLDIPRMTESGIEALATTFTSDLSSDLEIALPPRARDTAADEAAQRCSEVAAPTFHILGIGASAGEGREQTIDVTIRAVVRGDATEACVITLRPVLPQIERDQGMSPLAAERIDALELELRQTKESLQEMETSNDELQATNEELVAKVTEQERRSVERQLQGLLESSPAFIHAKDLQGRYVLANAGARLYAGVEPQDLLGKTDTDLLPPRTAEAVRANDRRVAASGVVHEFEESVPAADGSGPRVYLSIKWPVRDEEGRVSAVAGISSDITERKRVTEEHRAALERRDRFLAMLSHELRNPLSAAMNAVYAMSRADCSESLRGRAPQIIRRQIEHMGRLLDDLLDVTRLTQDWITVRRERVDMKRVVTHTVEAASEQLRRAGLTLGVEVCDAAAWVDGDVARLQQVLANLLSNSAKYTSPGGRVDIHLERQAGAVVLRVKDTGIGIEPALHEKVFELFYQVDTSLERVRGGLGVGLSLVRTLVGLHGGQVAAHSEGLGKGSELVVSLPAIEAAGDGPSDGGAPPVARARARVAIVEDLADSRELLTELVRESGFEVEDAGDGVAAVALIERLRPDVALIDIGLPILDGYEVARRVRATPAGRDMYLVAVTGYGRAEDRRRTLEAGFDEHLVKPLEPEAVLALLARVKSPTWPRPRSAP